MKIILSVIMLSTILTAQTRYLEINNLVQSGEFTQVIKMINKKLETETLSPEEVLNFKFEKERLERIKKDFNKTAEDVLNFVNKYYPNANEKDLEKWERTGSLEFKIIDGKKWYFSRAASNLFRINKEAEKQKELVDGYQKDGLDAFLENYIPVVLNESANAQEKLVKPVTFNLNYTLTVDANSAA